MTQPDADPSSWPEASPAAAALEARREARQEQRLEALEVKAAFTEDLLDQLNDIVVRQQSLIDRLVEEVARLKALGSSAEPTTFRSLRDEIPPHY